MEISIIQTRVLRLAIWALGITLLVAGCKSARDVADTSGATTEIVQREFKQHFFTGQKERLSGNVDGAIKSFKKCIELKPNESAPYYELGRLYERQSRLESAVEMLAEAIRLEDSNIWYQGMYAQLNARIGNYDKAVKTYKNIIQQYPNQYDYYFELAGTYIMLGNYDEAIKLFDSIEEKLGLNEEIALQKQMLYMEMGKPKEAIREVIKLTELAPEEIRYWGILAELYDASGEREKAMEIYAKLAEMDDDNGMLRLSLAEFHRNAGDMDKAFVELQRAFKSPDLDIDAKINVLLTYYQETETDRKLIGQAYELCELLLEQHPDEAKAHSIYGDFLYRDERFAEARESFGKAAEIDKNRFVLWNQMLILDSQLEDFDSMVSTSEQAIELFPTMPSFYLFHGVGLMQQNRFEEAVESLLAGIDLVVDNFGQLAQFYASLGDAYHELGEHTLSDEAYDNSLSINEDNAYVLNNYSYYLSLRGESLDKALKMSKRANELQPGEASFQDTKAWVLFRKGRYEDARQWLEKAMDNGGSTQGVILEHYGDVLFKLNRIDEAVEYWKRARDAGDASELIDRKIADKKLHE